jgi:hypothetical protein
VALDAPGGGRLLLQRAGAERRSVDAPARRHEGQQVEVGLEARAHADDGDATAGGERPQVVLDVRGAHQLEHDVEGTVVDELVGNDHAGAEGSDPGAGRLRADRRDDLAARGHGQLDGGGADAARGPVDAHPLAHAELALREQGVVSGGVVLGEAARLGPADAFGHREGDDLGHDGQLGLAGAGDDRHHRVARTEAPATGPDRDHLARQLEAGQVGRRRAGRRRVQALGLHEVAAAHAGGPHPHQ